MMTTLSVTCPGCRVSQLVDQSAVVAVCSGCTKRIRCTECGSCGYSFAALEQRGQCPRCLNTIEPGEEDIPFAALAERRQGGVVPVDTGAVAAVRPEVINRPKGRHGLRWVPLLVAVLALAIAGIAVLRHPTTPNVVACPLAKATSTLTLAASRTADGNYHVTATGATVSRSTRMLHDVVVTWVATYADGSMGTTTATLLPQQGSIAPGATSRWSGAAAAKDGPVQPIGVKVLHTYTTLGHPTCLT